MKLKVEVNLEDFWFDDETVARILRDEIEQQIRAAVRKAVKEGIAPELTKQVTEAARKAHQRTVTKALEQFGA